MHAQIGSLRVLLIVLCFFALVAQSVLAACPDGFAALNETVDAGRPVALTPRETEVARAIDKVFLIPQTGPPSAELQRVDALLAVEINRSTESMSPKTRANFLRIMEQAKPGLRGLVKPAEGVVALTQNSAQVQANKKDGLMLAIDLFATGHPIGRLYLRHEASHLSRFVSEATNPKDANRFMYQVTHRRFGVYREEVAAFRDQYRFMRKAYKESDLPRLRESMPGPTAEDLELLKSRGIIVEQTEGAVSVDFAKGSSEENQAAFYRYMDAQLNVMFVKDLEKVFSLSESAYIKGWVRGADYRGQQQAYHIDNAIQKTLRSILYGSVAAAGTGAAVFVYEK